MAKDSQFNIFDSSSNKPARSPAKKAADKPQRKLSLQEIAEKAHALSDQEIINMVERIQFLQKDLESKVNILKEKIPMTYSNIGKFLNDKENFPPEQWSAIEENRAELEKKLWSMVGDDPKKVKEKHQVDKDTKELRGKGLGARRNWIPIR